MSFSYEVKTELCRADIGPKTMAAAQAYGVLLFANTFSPREIRIVTGNADLASHFPRLFKRAFGLDFDSVSGDGERKKKIFLITDENKLNRVLSTYGYEAESLTALHINLGALEDEGAKESFLRGAFMAGGSVTDPEKRYHLELSTTHPFVSRELPALLSDMGFESRLVRRGQNYVTYFKMSSAIEDLLTKIGAPVAAMKIMNTKIEKDMTNSVNRRVNCDTANVLKTVVAAEEQLHAVKRLREAGAFEALPEKLREVAEAREENPEMRLSELAAFMGLTKSGLSHRMKKLADKAAELD